jgi:tRNA/rRNA methyltransferase
MSLDRVTIVLARPQQPGNVGLAARAMAAHGLARLVLVQPQGFDPDRARWMAPNAHHIIDAARFCGSIAEALEGSTRVVGTTARPRRWRLPVWTPAQVAVVIADEPADTAIVFGPEDAGLSTDDLALCHGILTLPTEEDRSVNLGVAVSIACAALAAPHSTGLADSSVDPSEPSPVWLQDAVVNDAVEVLDAAGYLNGRNPRQVHSTLYRLLARAQPTERESANLRGMSKQLLWWFRARSGQ